MSPSGKAAVFGTAISEVRVLPPQNIKDLSSDGSFLTSRNGVLSPPSFHSRRSFKRGSTLSGILPRTAHVVRLRCKRVLTTQKLNLSLDGSFLTSRNGVLSPPSFHFRRSFKRGSTLSGILPRTAHVVRLRCKRVLTTQNINVCAFLFLGCSTSVERVFQIVLLIRCTINLTSSRKSFVHI